MDELLKLGVFHDGCSDLLDQIETNPKFKSLQNKAQHIEESADLLLVDFQRDITHGKTATG